MAYGAVKVIPSGQHEQIFVPSGQTIPSVAVLNPNDGILYVARDRDVPGIGFGAWDWKVPSQSYAHLPGPFGSVGAFYLDQSGAGRSGEITIYMSRDKLDIPDFHAIGRSLTAIETTLDVTEGTLPANPGVGTARLWVDSNHILHLLDSGGVDRLEVTNLTALGGVLTGTLPNPGLAGLVVTQGHLVKPSVSTGELFDAGITQAKLAKPSVGTAELFDANISQAKLAKPSVGTAELLTRTITNDKISLGSLTSAEIAFGTVGKIILDVRAASDLWSNTALGAGYNGIGGFNSNFGTVDETGDLLVGIVELAVAAFAPPVQAYWGSALYLDGVLYKRFPGIFIPASTPAQYFGGGVCYLPGIAAGSHNFEIRVYVSASGMSSGAYLRCASFPESEYAAITILELRR